MFHDATGNGIFLDCVFPEETTADKQTAIISSLSVVGTGSRQWHRSVQQSPAGILHNLLFLSSVDIKWLEFKGEIIAYRLI